MSLILLNLDNKGERGRGENQRERERKGAE
jgi:hypothetical protein